MSIANKANFPLRAPRAWHGMTTPIWLQLLANHGFSISPARVPMAVSVTAVSCLNTLGRVVEDAIYARRAQQIDVPAPLFIVGHWRTGTTLLHELLVQDEQFGYPTMYDCMAPHHFLHTHRIAPFLAWLLPKHRPMDNMPIGFGRPQEDEFALCNLGVPSPYLTWAFPNESRYDRYLDLLELPAAERRAWMKTFMWFLKRLTIKDPRRLVLKSPTHTARLKTLLELFPDAQFVHTTRDPFVVVPSTLLMWERMSDAMGLNTNCRQDLEDHLFRLSSRMQSRFEQDRRLIAPTQICDVQFEQLVEDPVNSMEHVYRQLRLGDFESVRAKLATYAEQTKGYRRNRHEPPAALQDKIAEHWSDYLDRYGYSPAALRAG